MRLASSHMRFIRHHKATSHVFGLTCAYNHYMRIMRKSAESPQPPPSSEIARAESVQCGRGRDASDEIHN
jgi:hypothetical protein